MHFRIGSVVIAASLLVCAPLAATAQAWPSKPITYIVPFTPGGTTDIIGRTIGQNLSPVPNALYVDPQLPVNSVQELIAFLKKEPNKRTFASSGAGTSTHLAGELFADLIDVKLTHVPYKGTPPAMQDVAGGQVTFMFDQLTAGAPLVKAGKLRLLAVTTAKRTPLAPDTPTMAEAGVEGFEMVSWQAVYAPKGTPKPIVDRLNTEVVKILKTPDVRDKLVGTNGMEVIASSPQELTALMQREIPRWAELIKKSGATPN
jgi:tripartite-type tricarboxylate transporter receptor subunit TctC